jgi:hypothetical protein
MRKYLLPSGLILIGLLSWALAQNITKSIQMSQMPGAIGVDASNNVYFPAHLLNNGKTPSFTAGISSITGTDAQGLITEASNSVGGTITFNQAYNAAPNCVLVAQTASSSTPLTFSTVTTSLTYSHVSQVSQKLNYLCSGAS